MGGTTSSSSSSSTNTHYRTLSYHYLYITELRSCHYYVLTATQIIYVHTYVQFSPPNWKSTQQHVLEGFPLRPSEAGLTSR